MGRRKRDRRKRDERSNPKPALNPQPDRPDRASKTRADNSIAIDLACSILIAITIAIAFHPASHAEFVDWDDYQNLTRNEHIQSLSSDNLVWMATTGYMAVWQPVSWFVTALQYQFFNGADATAFSRGMHLTNIALHVVASILCFLVIRQLLQIGASQEHPRPKLAFTVASLIATLFYAVHPLRVELVAWATAQPYILALVGCLASLWCYLRSQLTGRRRWLVFSWIAFALAVMCKSAAMPFFAIILLIDWCPLRRIGGRAGWFNPETRTVLLEKVPVALVATFVAFVAPIAKGGAGSTMSLQAHGVIARTAQACYGLVFYVWKTLVPAGLSPLYEIQLPLPYTAARYIACALIVALAAVGLVLITRRRPAVTACILTYTIMVFPVLGFLQSGNQEVADRYSYLPCVAWSALLAAGVLKLWDAQLWSRVTAGALTLVVTLLLAMLTREQCGVWKNTAALWTRAWTLQPDSSLAQNSYGYVLMQQGRLEEAVPHLRRAIEIKGDNDKAHHNLRNALYRLNRTDELLEACLDALRVFPKMPEAHLQIGNILYERADLDSAVNHYRQAIDARPDYANAHGSLAVALYRIGNKDGSMRHAERALELDPTLMPPRRVLARALRDAGRLDEAIEQLRAGLRIEPDNSKTQALMNQMTRTR